MREDGKAPFWTLRGWSSADCDPGDLVEPAGYPASAGERLVRVARFGRVIAVLAYADDGHGGWLIGTTRTCPGAGITVEGPA